MTVEQRYGIEDLLYLMARLRSPEDGCPWDLAQNYRDIVPHTLEEVYEVVDTIERGDYQHLGEELGDLLFQVVFYARLAQEEGRFDFDDVVHGIVAKLLFRHPHVFPEGTLGSRRSDPGSPQEEDIKRVWEERKAQERSQKGFAGALADIPNALPALTRAQKIQKRASKQGFDWPEASPVIDKIREEIAELEAEIEIGQEEGMAEEIGDLLFTCVNLARHLGLDAETALRRATAKFEHRYEKMVYDMEARGEKLDKLAPDIKEQFWQRAKGS